MKTAGWHALAVRSVSMPTRSTANACRPPVARVVRAGRVQLAHATFGKTPIDIRGGGYPSCEGDHTMRNSLAISIGALLALATPPPPSIGGGLCLKVTEEKEFCPDCPGISSCVCLYESAYCPSTESGCYSRNIAEPDIDAPGVLFWAKPCSWSQPCASKLGGACLPIFNVCQKSETSSNSGTMLVVEQVTGPCEPI